MFTGFDDEATVRSLVAASYALKYELPETVVDAIRAVASGRPWFSKEIVELMLLWAGAQATSVEPCGLTGREREILGMIVEGLDNARIAGELGLAQQTVRNYVTELYAKLGVSSRPEAIVWARERGIAGR